MMYPFLTLPDGTVIVHSEAQMIDGKEQVKVYVEKPCEGGFKSAVCSLPEYRWTGIQGFDQQEMEKIHEIVSSSAHLLIRFAREGGVEGNASNF